MITDIEGIILRQTKTLNGRKMLVLFSGKFGKISVGTYLGEKGRSRTNLALRPFTYGRYTLYQNKNSFNMNNAETIKSYYKVGEDINKYMNASYVIELTEKITEEGQPMTGLLNLLIDFLDSIENRKKNQNTLTLAYEIKALKHLGLAPELSNCICCGREIKAKQAFMNLSEGGITCPECRIKTIENPDNEKLIYSLDFGIVDVLKYLLSNPMKNLEKVALDEEVYRKLHRIIRNYLDYHMGIGSLKSEGFI